MVWKSKHDRQIDEFKELQCIISNPKLFGSLSKDRRCVSVFLGWKLSHVRKKDGELVYFLPMAKFIFSSFFPSFSFIPGQRDIKNAL